MTDTNRIPEQSSDEQLMALAAKGRRSAFELLYDRYFSKLTWYAYGMLKDMHRAEDLVQDVFCLIVDRPETFDSARTFSTWIYTLVGNRCKNELRNITNRSALLKEHEVSDRHSELHGPGDRYRLQQQIHNLLSACSDKERQIYHLRFEQELKVKEIAAILEIPEGSVKSGIFYLVQKFAQHLKEFKDAQ